MTFHRIGEWSFDPTSGELSRGAERRRLEPRAARTLQLLCEAEGAVVPHDAILAEVWGGRSLSDNSLSIVVGQLRKVLGDDSRQMIESVPKRGYRLNPTSRRASAANRPRLALALAALILALAALAVVMLQPAARPVIAVADVVNATGIAAFDPHARATSELIVTELGRRGFDVRRTPGGSDLAFAAKLVMWDGKPSLGMTATDARGMVRWSGMTSGGPAEVPAGVSAQLDRFAAEISPR